MRRIPRQRFIVPLLFVGIALLLAQLCRGGSVGFENTGSLAQAREYHTATLLTNGKVLVVGGYNANNTDVPRADLASAELYDPATGTWTSTGSLANRRSNHTAT